jgi:acetyltransferase-like isoleucine patch superfamily enzyme
MRFSASRSAKKILCDLQGLLKPDLKIKNMPYSLNHRPIEDPLGIFPKALTKLYSAWVSRTYPFARMGRDVSFHFTCKLSRQRSTRISLGDSVKVSELAWLNVATDDPAGEPTIVIDDNCIIATGSIISAKNQIHLEPFVNIAQQVLIMDHNHAYENIEIPIIEQGITEGGRIRIGEGSWIGRGAAILCSRGELTIGRHCVVSANSVVMRSIPDYSVVFGTPATVIRQYDPEKRAWRMGQRRNASISLQESIAKPSSRGHAAELVEKSYRAAKVAQAGTEMG